MLPREVKVNLLVMAIYLVFIMTADQTKSTRTVALTIRWYGNRCLDLGNWAYGQSIRSENAYRELIAP